MTTWKQLQEQVVYSFEQHFIASELAVEGIARGNRT